LVNNAATFVFHPVAETTEEEFDQEGETNAETSQALQAKRFSARLLARSRATENLQKVKLAVGEVAVSVTLYTSRSTAHGRERCDSILVRC
jgi:hypothetical protein